MNRIASRLSLFLLALAYVAAGCASTGDAPSGGSKASTPANAAAAPAGKDAGKPASSTTAPAAAEANKTAAAKSAPPPSRIGDVKISLFTLGKGKFSTKEAVGTYFMVVNPSWVRHKRPYTEPFFPVAKPGLKIVEDEIMEGLLKHLADCGFWNMPEAAKIDVAALRRPNVDNVRYVTVTRDGVTRTVERERLGASGLLNKFIDMEYGINQVWHASSTYVTETQRQNWIDAFQTHYELRKAQDRAAEQGTAPGAGGDPGTGAPAGTPKDGSGAAPGGSTGK